MPRGGSKPGERRGGRQPGSFNKITNDIRLLAQEFGPSSVARLAKLAGLAVDEETGKAIETSESGPTQVAAIKELLDRAYGKATQPVQHGVDDELEAILYRIGRD